MSMSIFRVTTLSSLCLLFFSGRLMAQEARVATFDHIAIVVRNIDSTSRFYGAIFHFDTLPHAKLPLRYQWLSIGGGQALHIVEGLKDTVSMPFFDHFCFSVPSLTGFATSLDRLGVPYYSGPDRIRGFRTRPDSVRQLFFQDPDKYWVEVNDASKPQSDTATIRQLEKLDHDAILANDTATLFKYWAPEFAVNNPGDHVSTLEQVKGFLRKGMIDYSDFESVIEKITIIDNVALVMGHEIVKPKGNTDNVGKTVTRRVTDIWMKRNGQWQMIGRQATITKSE